LFFVYKKVIFCQKKNLKPDLESSDCAEYKSIFKGLEMITIHSSESANVKDINARFFSEIMASELGCPRKWVFLLPRKSEFIGSGFQFRGIPQNSAEFRGIPKP
jgi:hypothetical protein